MVEYTQCGIKECKIHDSRELQRSKSKRVKISEKWALKKEVSVMTRTPNKKT